jgi:hypothetical protein
MSDCGIALGGYEDYGSQSFYSETAHVARRAHSRPCRECQQPITAGSRYVQVVGKSGSDFWAWKICGPCMDLLKEFSEDGSWTFGELWGEIHAAWNAGQPLQSCVNRVPTVAMKSKLRDEWIRYKGIDG